ncbi:hypothetical protein ABZ815_49845 [Nonomuraea sp. NPDC047529]|uniref:hypothetical protein n=1 Tax=Nonomuraea sp. NPDC047529 TaxID=3155623 RepID=UPI0033FFA250
MSLLESSPDRHPPAADQSWSWGPLILPREKDWACGCSPNCPDMSVVALISHNPDWRYGLCEASARESGCPETLLAQATP